MTSTDEPNYTPVAPSVRQSDNPQSDNPTTESKSEATQSKDDGRPVWWIPVAIIGLVATITGLILAWVFASGAVRVGLIALILIAATGVIYWWHRATRSQQGINVRRFAERGRSVPGLGKPASGGRSTTGRKTGLAGRKKTGHQASKPATGRWPGLMKNQPKNRPVAGKKPASHQAKKPATTGHRQARKTGHRPATGHARKTSYGRTPGFKTGKAPATSRVFSNARSSGANKPLSRKLWEKSYTGAVAATDFATDAATNTLNAVKPTQGENHPKERNTKMSKKRMDIAEIGRILETSMAKAEHEHVLDIKDHLANVTSLNESMTRAYDNLLKSADGQYTPEVDGYVHEVFQQFKASSAQAVMLCHEMTEYLSKKKEFTDLDDRLNERNGHKLDVGRARDMGKA